MIHGDYRFHKKQNKNVFVLAHYKIYRERDSIRGVTKIEFVLDKRRELQTCKREGNNVEMNSAIIQTAQRKLKRLALFHSRDALPPCVS